ncbi:DNA gyrase subunit A [mine drainage metagenome]|uniref:DNA gyrase subunit A n=1 Tax=mine drainage metagenome TaxID=410659 RepID=A0A1J5PN57_9ZZZZ
MKFRKGDELLSMSVVSDSEEFNLLTATDGGYAKRTPVVEYRVQGRGGLGVKAAKIDEVSRGVLVCAVVVRDDDEIVAITSSGSVIRTGASEVRQTGRDTMGVRLVNLKDGDLVVSVARNAESEEILTLEESPSLGEVPDSV